MFQLEEDVKLLEKMYPQGEKAETAWALTVLGYLAKLVLGILGLLVSVAWVPAAEPRHTNNFFMGLERGIPRHTDNYNISPMS